MKRQLDPCKIEGKSLYHRTLLGTAALGIALIGGCAPAHHTPEWYALNQEARQQVLDACAHLGIARVVDIPDCVNAEAGIPIAINQPGAVNPYAR